MRKPVPSVDAWLKEGEVRYGAENTRGITGMMFPYDQDLNEP